MGGNILTKEIFVDLVMREQERKKESGIKLEKIDDNVFYNFLTDILLEFGADSKKETPKTTVKETKKKVTKKQEIVIEQIVVSNESKKDLKTDLANDIVFDAEVVKVIKKEKRTKRSKKVQKIEVAKVFEDVKTKGIDTITKVKKEKVIEPVFKTKEIPRKDGLMQLAFDF